MPSDLQNLDTIFNSRLFRIPDYQRGYAWKKEQLEDFWQDLDRLGEQRRHYTGQLTLEEVPPDSWGHWSEDTWLITRKSYRPSYIVDGQQRLTTAIILIKCLLDRIPDGGSIAFTEKSDHQKKYLSQISNVSRAYVFGYEKDNPSYEYLKTQILGEPSNQYEGTETTYTANLLRAKNFFCQMVKDATTEQLERWFKDLTQRFVFNVYELDKGLEAFVVFETMNNRGKPLSRLELLKNRLVYLSTLLPQSVSNEDRQAFRRNVNDAWKTVFEFLGREKDRALDDDEFLRAHWIMYFTYAREDAGQFADFLLGEHFTTQRVADGKLTVTELQRYVTSVQDSVRIWHAINFPDRVDALEPGVRLRLERQARLGRGAFGPLFMAAMQQKGPGAELPKLLDATDRFVFTVGRLCRRRADTGDSKFYRLAGQLFRQELALADTTKQVDERTDRHFSLDTAIAETHELFRHDGVGFYGWEGLRYFLFEYEQRLKAVTKMQTSKLDWRDLNTSKKDHVTIEHIYPESPVSGDWPMFDLRRKRERDMLRNSLGNLLALSQSRNSKFSNRWFAEKRQGTDGTQGYFNGSYSEIQVSQQASWTPEAVLERGLEMLGFLEERWKVALGSRADKIKLLNLEFLEPADGAVQAESMPNS